MSGKRYRVRIADPGKFAGSMLKLVLVIAVIVFAVRFLGNLGKDPVARQLKKLEGQDVQIISTEILVYKGDNQYKDDTLRGGDVLVFKVNYKYQLMESKNIKNHPVEDGVTVTIDEASAAYAEQGETPNTVKIRTGITQDTPITLKVSYSGNKDLVKEYNYTVLSDTASGTAD